MFKNLVDMLNKNLAQTLQVGDTQMKGKSLFRISSTKYFKMSIEYVSSVVCIYK